MTKAFNHVGIPIRWEGEGVAEKGYHSETNEILVEVDEKYFRPTEVDLLLGDATKARTELGWKTTYTFDELVKEMVTSDLELFKRDQYLIAGGHKIYDQNE